MTRSKTLLAAAAYTLVDLSSLDAETRKDIIQDAHAGGGNYGIRVVEESINGGASAPIYGFYKEGPDAERWADAKKELGISSSDVDDAEAYASAGVGVLEADPRREAALREAAAQRSEAEAERIRAGEVDAVRAITGDEDDDESVVSRGPQPTGATDNHPINTVDTTLDPNATNEAANAEPAEPAKESGSKSKSKTPR